MGLQETLEEQKRLLAEALEAENNQETEEEEETQEDEIEPEAAEAVAEEPVKEPEKEPELDASGYARLRREKAAAEKKARELEERLAVFETKPQEKQENNELVPEIAEIVHAHRYAQARQEFIALENDFRSRVPNYDAVAEQYNQALYQSIKVQNPHLSNNQITKLVEEQVMTKAANYLNQGFDPIEELFEGARSLGFTGEQAASAVEEKRPNLSKLAANKDRNAGTAAASGRGEGGQATLKYAAGMSSAEWIKLPKADKDRILGRR